MQKKIVVCLVASLLVVVSGGAVTGHCADYESGKTIYDKKCAICHGADGRGDTPAAAAYSPSPTDFNSASFWQSMSDAKIRETVEKGHGSMPRLNISSGETNAVINYMKQTFKP
jgi:mono/diheme cytochrome c family protein